MTPSGGRAGSALPSFYRPQFHTSIGSTNDEAKRLAEAGAPEGTLVVADEQTAGRGRRGRGFTSPPGNLYMSLVMRPRRPLPLFAQLSFVVAVALAETIAASGEGVDVAVKWPNDVLVRGRKVSGILLESAFARNEPAWVVLGIGVNLVSSPPELAGVATCLRDEGLPVPGRDSFLAEFGRTLADWIARWRGEGFAPIRTAWLARAAFVGERIAVRLADREFGGVFEDLDADGNLLLRMEDGTLREIGAGEIFRPAA